MARRIEIELTSTRGDGTWTWRAPGARQPKGTVDGTLLPEDAAVGTVYKAEAEFELEGIVIAAVVPNKTTPQKTPADRIEIIGTAPAASGVSVILAGRGKGRRDSGDRPGRGESGQRPRQGRPDSAGGSERPARGPRSAEAGGSQRRPRSDSPRDGQVRGERPARADGPARSERPAAPDRGPRPGRAPSSDRSDRPARGERPRGPQASTTFRNAALGNLRPEEIPIAEQILRGGIPAVRQAIEEQNARARSEDRREITAEPLLEIAEKLLPVMNLAAWKDRAVTARLAGKEAPLRELRSIVSGASTVVLDEEGRELSKHLRDALDARVKALRDTWLERITSALDAGRVADALRTSARAPEPAARVPADLAVRLAEQAGEALSPDLDAAQWLAVLEAVIDSPVKRTVRPKGLPPEAGPDLQAAARRAAGQVPELAKLLGLPIPPPPGPRRPAAIARRS